MEQKEGGRLYGRDNHASSTGSLLPLSATHFLFRFVFFVFIPSIRSSERGKNERKEETCGQVRGHLRLDVNGL